MTVWPLALQFFLAVLPAALMIGLSFFLGERHDRRAMGEPYESGISPTGSKGSVFALLPRTFVMGVRPALAAAIAALLVLLVWRRAWPGLLQNWIAAAAAGVVG